MDRVACSRGSRQCCYPCAVPRWSQTEPFFLVSVDGVSLEECVGQRPQLNWSACVALPKQSSMLCKGRSTIWGCFAQSASDHSSCPNLSAVEPSQQLCSQTVATSFVELVANHAWSSYAAARAPAAPAVVSPVEAAGVCVFSFLA